MCRDRFHSIALIVRVHLSTRFCQTNLNVVENHQLLCHDLRWIHKVNPCLFIIAKGTVRPAVTCSQCFASFSGNKLTRALLLRRASFFARSSFVRYSLRPHLQKIYSDQDSPPSSSIFKKSTDQSAPNAQFTSQAVNYTNKNALTSMKVVQQRSEVKDPDPHLLSS
jgi:hypothetical protein